MKVPKIFSSAAILFLSIGVLSLLAACMQPARRPEPDNLFWPEPPTAPRIKYIQSIYSEDDLGREYSFSEKIFGKQFFDGFMRPYGVFAAQGKLLVTDIAARSVLVYDLEEKRLKTIISGSRARFKVPAAVTIDSSGAIYIADSGGSSVSVCNESGDYKTAFSIPGSTPVSLALNERLGRLYVGDRLGQRIVVFDLKGSQLFEFGGGGTELGRLNVPLGLAIGGNDLVYVLDSGNFRVQVFTADGGYLNSFGQVGDMPGTFANPKGIALDPEDHIYVTDSAFSNFQIFDREGRLLLYVGTGGRYAGSFHLPAGIAIDTNGRIYVADQLNSRIEVFQYLEEQEPNAQP